MLIFRIVNTNNTAVFFFDLRDTVCSINNGNISISLLSIEHPGLGLGEKSNK